MYWTGKPQFVYLLWASGCADIYCATDKDLPIHPLRRAFWRVRGEIVSFLFGWWWWVKVTRPTLHAPDAAKSAAETE